MAFLRECHRRSPLLPLPFCAGANQTTNQPASQHASTDHRPPKLINSALALADLFSSWLPLQPPNVICRHSLHPLPVFSFGHFAWRPRRPAPASSATTASRAGLGGRVAFLPLAPESPEVLSICSRWLGDCLRPFLFPLHSLPAIGRDCQARLHSESARRGQARPQPARGGRMESA